MSALQIQLALSVCALALLTFTVLFTLGTQRYKAAKSGAVDISFYKLYQGHSEPDNIRKLSRNLTNLFEMPVLFYAGVILTLSLSLESTILVYLAWIFVALRYLHSFIHCTKNKVKLRFRVYLISTLILLSYWCLLTFKLIAII